MNRMHKHEVTSFIAQVAERLDLRPGLFANERRRDGTSVGLAHPDGWYLDVRGGRVRQSDYSRPETYIVVRGMIANPTSHEVEHLTIHGVPAEKVWFEGVLNDRDAILDRLSKRLAPAVAEYAGVLSAKWARERAKREQSALVRERLGMGTEEKKRFDLPLCGSAEVVVSSWQRNPERISVGLRLEDLSVDEAEAVLAIIRARRAN